eukprot:CAMPEP_0117426432 /NCGR_PEP_ID=MMETSP0758-20121206/6552_1 /TAXON_ID=63605 /ORGANISM="Percolomonas cosmopolitus, Strain AE-1 (ATCC 50343)" /LENGTH=648 /DNA_ID=CAMNT_0005211607 /DNA_START=165 /DNA_END=2111 /DNA_ORIENTATION=-
MTGENDRFGFEQALIEVEQFFNDMEKSFGVDLESARADLTIMQKEKDLKIVEWRERYQKLHTRWNECVHELKKLHEDKEDIRQQRDLLLCTHKAKKAMVEKDFSSSRKDKRIKKEFFQEQVASRILNAIADAIGAERGAIFVKEHKYLKSIALVPPLLKDGKPVEIKVPADQGFVGTVFKNKEALNILNAYKDKRFYRKVDHETGFITRVVLCYPLINPTTEESIGVLQLINKDNGEVFTVEDEARMSEYVYLVSQILEGVQKLYAYGPYVKQQDDKNTIGASPSTPLTPSKTENNFGSSKRKKLINVKRIGGDVKDPNDDIGPPAHKMRQFLIPKEIEEYIHSMEEAWRKSVNESADYQNKKAVLEEEAKLLKVRMANFEKKSKDQELTIKDLQQKMTRYKKELKTQRVDWQNQEKEYKYEIKELQQLSSTLQKHHNSKSRFHGPKLTSPNRMSNSSFSSPNTIPGSITLPVIDFSRRSVDMQDSQTKAASPAPHQATTTTPPVAVTTTKLNKKYRDVYNDMFSLAPVPMALVTRSFRIWRVNSKFCELLDCQEQDLLGVIFSDVAVGVDSETLPRLLQFDIVQGLGLHAPSPMNAASTSKPPPSSSFIKVNVQIAQLGHHGQRFSVTRGHKSLPAPIYSLVFTRKK